MEPRIFLISGFEGRGGKYLVPETSSAGENRDLRDARTCSGFPTTVYSNERELTLQELDHFADL